MVNCQVCGKHIADVRKPSVAQRVEGWIVKRNAGGANHIRHQERYPEYAHVVCLPELRTQGKQDSLSFG